MFIRNSLDLHDMSFFWPQRIVKQMKCVREGYSNACKDKNVKELNFEQIRIRPNYLCNKLKIEGRNQPTEKFEFIELIEIPIPSGSFSQYNISRKQSCSAIKGVVFKGL